MRTAAALFAALALAVIPVNVSTAQETPPVKTGDRVRITHACVAKNGGGIECQSDAGTLAMLSKESVVLDAGTTRPPCSALRAFQHHSGIEIARLRF